MQRRTDLGAYERRQQTEVRIVWGRTVAAPDPGFRQLGSRYHEPPADVMESSAAVVVVVDVAGLPRQKFQLEVRGNILRISGDRPSLDHPPGSQYHQLEIWSGAWQCDVELPAPVDVDGLTIRYDRGLLRLEFPKPARRPSRD